MKTAIVRLLRRYPPAYSRLRRTYQSLSARLLLRIHDKGSGNEVSCSGATVLGSAAIDISGNGNRVSIGQSMLHNVRVSIRGDGNHVQIGDQCGLHELEVVCIGDSNVVSIGSGTVVSGAAELAALEGRRISIGDDCLFGRGIHIRTSDSHSVTNASGCRVNPPADVSIGRHVWIASWVTILKGVTVSDHSVIGIHSVVTRRFDEANCVIAGNPAAIVRTGIDWHKDLLPWDFLGQHPLG